MRSVLALAGLIFACRSAPEEVVRLDGPGVVDRVAKMQAQVVVLNLWATWCDPCREEFPTFVDVGRRYRDRGVEVLFVSLDFPDEVPAVLAFLDQQGVSRPAYLREGKDHLFIDALHPRWSGVLPATFIYGPDRKRRFFWEGLVDGPTLEAAIETALSEAEGGSP